MNPAATTPLKHNISLKKCSNFLAYLKSFQDFKTNTKIHNITVNNQIYPVYVNEFWTSKQRAAHPIHEVSYRACFKPQLPRLFIEHLTNKGDTVYDPFMGRGTTIIEASLMERHSIGNDINPLSKILCSPRLSPPTLESIEQRLSSISFKDEEDLQNLLSTEELHDLSAFYHPKTLGQLCSLKKYLAQRSSTKTLDSIDQWIQMVTTNRLTGHSPGFLSVYTLPPNQAVTPTRQRKINQTRNQTPQPKEIAPIVLKKSKSLLSKISQQEIQALHSSRKKIITSDSTNTPSIKSQSVDLIVTSPPFLDIVNYRSDNWLRCWFNDLNANDIPISQLRKADDWVEKMTLVLTELKRVLKPSGLIAFEVGELKNGTLRLEELVIAAAQDIGLKIHAVIINDQMFTKTSNCWGVDNKTKGTNTNRIVLLSP